MHIFSGYCFAVNLILLKNTIFAILRCFHRYGPVICGETMLVVSKGEAAVLHFGRERELVLAKREVALPKMKDVLRVAAK